MLLLVATLPGATVQCVFLGKGAAGHAPLMVCGVAMSWGAPQCAGVEQIGSVMGMGGRCVGMSMVGLWCVPGETWLETCLCLGSLC